ncbi:MAG: xylulokinase [Lachnospiraceae bacterium]|nr:xylulokinase [Lachnospiraceae bacterium]
MRRYLLGIDIGTSACKIAIFDRNGKVIVATTGDYPVYYPAAGWAEQNPEEWWSAVCKAIRMALEKGAVDPREIAGIGVDGQSWAAIAVDKEGNVLTNTPIWMDTRAKDICEELNREIGEKEIFSLAGNSLQPTYTTAKILWYQRELPEVYEKTDKILQCNSYIAYKLTNQITQDVSQGYGFHCFDMRKGTWDLEMCERIGIPMRLLPPIFACHEVIGTVTEKAAEETGLVAGIPVVAGGLDAACGTLGAGVIRPGQTQEQGGQAGGMSICTDTYQADPRLILGYHVIPGLWLLQGGTTGGGGVMRWMEREFGAYERAVAKERDTSSLAIYNELAEEVAPGSDGVVFLPYMSGERSPIWDPKAKGVFYGLDFSKTKGHLIRASMEGVAFSLQHNLEIAEQAGARVDVLRAMGGSANSRLWTQIKSDVTGKPIEVAASDTATTLGAAILAGVGVGMYESFEEAVALTVQTKRYHYPDSTKRGIYNKNYQTYLELYEQLKDTMSRS